MPAFISSISDQTTACILQDDIFTGKYIETNRERLFQSHEHLVRLLKKHDIEYRDGCNAGFYVWVNLGKKYLDTHPGETGEGPEFTDKLFYKLLENKVYVAHGTAYGSKDPGWLRLAFSHPFPWLEETMLHIVHALQ